MDAMMSRAPVCGLFVDDEPAVVADMRASGGFAALADVVDQRLRAPGNGPTPPAQGGCTTSTPYPKHPAARSNRSCSASNAIPN